MRRPDLPPLPVPRAQQERRDVVADLIQRATASEVPRLVKAADRIQDLVDQLEKDVAEHELSAELRAEAERLEARLAEIRGQIGGKRAASPASRKTHDNRAIREWAASAGIECPARGRIPRSVVEAFEGVNR
jgi:hypothetical protein